MPLPLPPLLPDLVQISGDIYRLAKIKQNRKRDKDNACDDPVFHCFLLLKIIPARNKANIKRASNSKPVQKEASFAFTPCLREWLL